MILFLITTTFVSLRPYLYMYDIALHSIERCISLEQPLPQCYIHRHIACQPARRRYRPARTKRMRRRLWAEIDSLPTMCRRVFLMSKRDGKRNSDIASTLGISIKTVEAHMHKAYATLRGRAKAIYLLLLQL